MKYPVKSSVPSGNTYDKHHSKNPAHRFVTNRFLKTLKGVIAGLDEARTLLDVGCGEGYVLDYIGKIKNFGRIEGVDISEEAIRTARELYPSISFAVSSAYNLCYKDSEFDLILACEVLEHLRDYNRALSELKRVTARYCIISVPLEPLWRILNVAQARYVTSLGNTPGHVQHWSKRTFLALMEKYFTVERLFYPLPWQVALCRK